MEDFLGCHSLTMVVLITILQFIVGTLCSRNVDINIFSFLLCLARFSYTLPQDSLWCETWCMYIRNQW